MSPQGALAAQASNTQRAIATQSFRSLAVGALRHEAICCCLGALERIEGTSKEEALSPIILEMATLSKYGRNNPP